MSSDRPQETPPRRRSLRQRMVVSFTSLAVVPLLAISTAVFFIARYDMGQIQGTAMAEEAQLLAEQLKGQIDNAASIAAGLSSLPEISAHLAGYGPYPRDILAAAKRFTPGLRSLDLKLLEQPASGPAAAGSVTWGTAQTLEFRVPVRGIDGAPLGVLEATFNQDCLRRLLERFQQGQHGRGKGVLFTAAGVRLAGARDVPLPPERLRSAGWTVFEGEGEEYFAGITALTRDGGGVFDDWYVAVVQEAGKIRAPFYFAAQQVALILFLFGTVVIALAWRLADQFLKPILEIRHGAEIVSRINLRHRIEVDTGDELEELAEEFNRMAESLRGTYDKLEERVRQTTRSLQEERNRLAGVLRTMVEGVVVTNEEAESLLMNPRARLLLGSGLTSVIGAPLARLLPAARVEFYLRRVRRAWEEGREAVEDVVFPMPQGKLLEGSLAAVPGPEGERSGFLMVFREIGAEAEEELRLEDAVRELPELFRGPMASAGTLLEAVERHPEMPDDKRTRFLGAVREELARLTDRLGTVERAAELVATSRWPGVPSDPAELVREAVGSVPGLFAHMELPETGVPPVVVEPFSWVAALARVLRWIADQGTGWAPVEASLVVEEETVITAFRVGGGCAGDPEALEALLVEPAGEPALTLGEVVRRNRGELWCRTQEDGFEVRLALMRAKNAMALVSRDGIVDQQPEFYDFDLFLTRTVREQEEMLNTSLHELEYVVFDTETTGLSPSKGDAVVSISAIRVRRDRVIQADTFHTLVNPQRRIPPESIEFHGITDDDVVTAPVLTDVLPRFYEYVGSAVLVAHNAAFDKKFLDLGASRADLPQLDNPILDTLFLSYGIHKEFEGHNLDAIAERMGITVEGRHTSLGDARATAEILVRLIPLLDARGVRTLGEAKAFCDRMLLMRWQSSRF